MEIIALNWIWRHLHWTESENTCTRFQQRHLATGPDTHLCGLNRMDFIWRMDIICVELKIIALDSNNAIEPQIYYRNHSCTTRTPRKCTPQLFDWKNLVIFSCGHIGKLVLTKMHPTFDAGIWSERWAFTWVITVHLCEWWTEWMWMDFLWNQFLSCTRFQGKDMPSWKVRVYVGDYATSQNGCGWVNYGGYGYHCAEREDNWSKFSGQRHAFLMLTRGVDWWWESYLGTDQIKRQFKHQTCLQLNSNSNPM